MGAGSVTYHANIVNVGLWALKAANPVALCGLPFAKSLNAGLNGVPALV